MNSNRRVLTLSELEAFDPQAPAGRIERRFWCPLCGENKPRDAAHRCLCANTESGLWNCKRCGEKGLLGEFRQINSDGEPQTRRLRAANALKRAFSLQNDNIPALDKKPPETAVKRENLAKSEIWRDILTAAVPIEGTDGERYLAQRGISLEAARRAGVLLSPSWHGRAALVFPFCDPSGNVVAIAGRCLQDGGLDKPAAGPKKQGAFFAPVEKFSPLSSAAPAIILCEAPFDALSLAVAGFPALALGGTSPPQWLAQKCAFRRVALAFDADAAGDAAADKIGASLASFGAVTLRLRPVGAKDWNEFLLRHGPKDLRDYLAIQLL
jgi:hypothetical protein